MSGGLFVNALLRDPDRRLTLDEKSRLQDIHADAYKRQVGKVRALPGARELLQPTVSRRQVPYAIARSGRMEFAPLTLRVLDLDPNIPIITRDQNLDAKPDPDLFLAAAKRIGVPIQNAYVVLDSVSGSSGSPVV